MSEFSQWIFSLALSPWAYVVLAGLLIIDGFFPFVPGETAVVTFATLGVTGHGPAPVAVFLVASGATMIGDGIAYLIGRRFGLARWPWMQRPRVLSMLSWATRGLIRRPAVFLISAKFVPIARVAVTITAGAGGLTLRRYLPISCAASVIYTGYHVVVAVAAGSAFAASPLLAAVVAIGTVIVLGGAIEGLGWLRKRHSGEPKLD